MPHWPKQEVHLNPEMIEISRSEDSRCCRKIFNQSQYFSNHMTLLVSKHQSHDSRSDLQNFGLLSADADLWDAAVPGNSQDALGVPAVGLSRISGRKSHHIVPPVPLQDPHHAACRASQTLTVTDVLISLSQLIEVHEVFCNQGFLKNVIFVV